MYVQFLRMTVTWDCCSKSLSSSPPLASRRRFWKLFELGVSQHCRNPTEVSGDVFRRLVARTMAQQLGPEIHHQSVSMCAVDESWHRMHCSRHPSLDSIGHDRLGQSVLGHRVLPGTQHCHSLDNFTGQRRPICGTTKTALFTPSCKQKVANKATHSCRHCLPSTFQILHE